MNKHEKTRINMNKLMILIIFLFSLSCTIIYDKEDFIVEVINENQNIFYVSDKIKYGGDYWQYANETEKLRTGDCEDIVIYIIDKLYKKYNIKCDLAIIKYSSTSGHALLHYCGGYYECQTRDGDIDKKGQLIYIVYFNQLDYNISINRE